MIFSGPRIYLDKNKLVNDVLYQHLLRDQNVLDLLEFSMLGLTGKEKHPDADGMQIIADYFFNLLSESV